MGVSSINKGFFIIFLLLLSAGFPARADTDADPPPRASAPEPIFEGYIYYADRLQPALKSVKKRFPATLDSHRLGLEIIDAVMAGPGSEALAPTWPEDTGVNAFFISDDKKAYVDLKLSKSMTAQMDTQAELMAVYSLVNSLTVNIPEIKMVKILINGKEARSLAGHIDLEFFYKTNMLIVK